jgi:hypothetical protein
VVDSALEPISSSAPLPQAQLACVQDVLASPAYTLSAAPGSGGPPTRVRLLIEF